VRAPRLAAAARANARAASGTARADGGRHRELLLFLLRFQSPQSLALCFGCGGDCSGFKRLKTEPFRLDRRLSLLLAAPLRISLGKTSGTI
jgi:hypothetical protein